MVSLIKTIKEPKKGLVLPQLRIVVTTLRRISDNYYLAENKKVSSKLNSSISYLLLAMDEIGG